MNSVLIVTMNGDESLFVNLKILSKIEAYQKVNTRGSLFKISPIEDGGYISSFTPQWLQRWMVGASRESDFSRIRDLYMLAFQRLEEKHDVENLKRHLEQSKKGLINLKKTYENDVTLQCRIDTLIERVDQNIQ